MLGWIFVAFAAGLVPERARPAWRLPRVRTWAWRVVEEERLAQMLRFRDVHPPREPR